VYTNSSDSHYVSLTPVSKQGNPDFYLGKCNTLEEFRGHPLFMHANSTHAYSYPTSSFDLTPSFSNVRFSIGSPTASSESVAFRNWCPFLWLGWVSVSSFTYYAYWSFTYFWETGSCKPHNSSITYSSLCVVLLGRVMGNTAKRQRLRNGISRPGPTTRLGGYTVRKSWKPRERKDRNVVFVKMRQFHSLKIRTALHLVPFVSHYIETFQFIETFFHYNHFIPYTCENEIS
jgi:hypothetical protein